MVAAGLAMVVALLGPAPDRLVDALRGEDRLELGRGLAEAGLPRLSTALLTEVLVLERGQAERVAATLDLYPLSLRGEPPPTRILATLGGQPVAGLSARHRSTLAFLVGQSLLASGRRQAAIEQLQSVAPGTPCYAPARYLMGVASLRIPGGLKTAGILFRQAVIEAETSHQSRVPVVREARRLALLGLARIHYEVNDLEVALYYYAQLPVGSPEAAEAEFESAWAHLHRGDLHRALGAVHGARTPGLHPGRHELHLMAGAALLGLCQYDRGRAELELMDKLYLQPLTHLRREADDLLDGEPLDLLGSDSPLTRASLGLLRGQPEIQGAQAHLAALDEEAARLRHYAADGEVAATSLLPRVEGLRAVGQARLRGAVTVATRRLLADQVRLTESKDFLMIDLLEEEGKALEAGIQAHRSGITVAAKPREAKVLALGADWQRWSFDGELWPDEVGTYRSRLPSLCAVGADAPQEETTR